MAKWFEVNCVLKLQPVIVVDKIRFLCLEYIKADNSFVRVICLFCGSMQVIIAAASTHRMKQNMICSLVSGISLQINEGININER